METTGSKEWVLRKVQKLLNLGTNRGATEGERDNAMRMAHSMLAKYNLDMADAEAHGKAKIESRGILTRTFYGRPWARAVSMSIGRLFFCKVLFVSHEEATQTSHMFIGKESNTVTAADMSQWLVESIRKEARRRNSREGDGTNGWMRSFCVGATNAISRRVAEMIEDRNPVIPGMSLVLASLYKTEEAANQVVLSAKFPKLSSTRSGKGARRDAHDSGIMYGNSMSLNAQVAGNKQRRLT